MVQTSEEFGLWPMCRAKGYDAHVLGFSSCAFSLLGTRQLGPHNGMQPRQ